MGTDRLRGWAGPIFLAACLLFGGASGRNAGALANAGLQGIAVLLIVFCLWTRRDAVYPVQARQLSWIVAAFVLLLLLSLVPLPPSWWQAVPGREPIAAGYSLLGVELPALPLSLWAQQTIASAMWLLPPVAMFLLVLQASPRQRRRMLWVVLVVAVVSIGLGAAQMLGGESSGLRLYEITNRTQPVGFFANANHQATLLLCALPLSGYLAARALARGRRAQRSGGLIVSVAIALFLLAGIGIIGSLAGYGLALPAALATVLIYRRASSGRLGGRELGGFAAIFLVFLGLALAGPLNSQALSEKVSGQPTSRGQIASTTLEGIGAYLPLGSGLGTFQDAYRAFDDPDRVSRGYTNHAHNDYLEVAFELGIPGLLIVLAFIAWWAVRSADVWRGDFEGAGLARAGSVIVLIVLLHSIVDYPIRTSAIAALFVLACGWLIPYSAPLDHAARPGERKGDEPLRHLAAD